MNVVVVSQKKDEFIRSNVQKPLPKLTKTTTMPVADSVSTYYITIPIH